VVVAGGRRCGCGNLGCLEAYASETAMRAVVAEREDALAQAVRERVAANGEGYTQALVALAEGGAADRAIREGAAGVIDEMVRILGVGLASAINLLDLETVVLAGGIAPAVLERVTRLGASMDSSLFARSVDRVGILAGVHGDDAGAIGAARLVKDPL
jgi:glucokinase